MKRMLPHFLKFCQVEQMRKAILDGLVPEFSSMPFPTMLGGAPTGPGPQFPPGKQNYMLQQNKVCFSVYKTLMCLLFLNFQ